MDAEQRPPQGPEVVDETAKVGSSLRMKPRFVINAAITSVKVTVEIRARSYQG